MTSGVLKITHAKFIADDSYTYNWLNDYKQAYISNALSGNPAYYNSREVTFLCDCLKPVSNYDRPTNIGNFASLISSGSGVAFSVPDVNSLTDFENWISNNTITFVYELAQPITVQLTPTEIETLQGTNNVWSDAGDTTVTYYVDINAIMSQLEAQNTSNP